MWNKCGIFLHFSTLVPQFFLLKHYLKYIYRTNHLDKIYFSFNRKHTKKREARPVTGEASLGFLNIE